MTPYISLMQWTLTHPVDGGVPMVNVETSPDGFCREGSTKVVELSDEEHKKRSAANKRTRKKREQKKRRAQRERDAKRVLATLGDKWKIQ